MANGIGLITMNRLIKWLLFGAFIITAFIACGNKKAADYPVKPVPFTDVHVDDVFWLPRMETNRSVTIPFALKKNEDTGRVNNFKKASGLMEGKYEGRRFNDTDVYKVMEGAAYSLSLDPDPELEKYLDSLIEIIAAAQEEDGYLYAARTVDPENPAPGAGPGRWTRLRGSHELYNAGHMYEAAVAHYLATGKRTFLDVAVKNADLLVKEFGPNKRRDFPGHQEIEIGLAKLFRVTGNKEYLKLAKFFLDERGYAHDGGLYPESSPFAIYNQKKYMQDHKPVLEQNEAVGHAVRASYMYAGVADVAALTGNVEYVRAIDRIWKNVVSKKMYLTGGIGARHTSEAFGDNYELPNFTAYTETCAAVGNVMWNHRLFLLHGDARYIDVMERVLYNGLISGVSLSGDRFFYQNPLESKGKYERSPWFEVACCPGNITRFIPSFPGYVYAQRNGILYVNLFVGDTAKIMVENNSVEIKQETRYPWEGVVKITIDPERSAEFTLNIRIPGWAQNLPVPSDLYRYMRKRNEDVKLTVNGNPFTMDIERGYARIRRRWRRGDVVELDFPMPVRRVICNENVKDNRGKVALERGPLVYCAEWVDNGGGVLDLLLPDSIELESKYQEDMLGGIVIIKGKVFELKKSDDGKFTGRIDRELIAIPYYAWAHRGEGEMAVWLLRF